jgi:hypothetical protein
MCEKRLTESRLMAGFAGFSLDYAELLIAAPFLSRDTNGAGFKLKVEYCSDKSELYP